MDVYSLIILVASQFNTTNDKLYVADALNHRIQVLNSDLSVSSSFGNKGSGKGQFNYPLDIACDRTGKVIHTTIASKSSQPRGGS